MKIPSLKLIKAVGVVAGNFPLSPYLNSAILVPMEWELNMGPNGELQNLRSVREDVSVRTIDLWLAASIGNEHTVRRLLGEYVRNYKYQNFVLNLF